MPFKRILGLLLVILLFFPFSTEAKEARIRIGYFPNITHAQAIVGIANGVFQNEIGSNIKIDTKVFNAGPSVIEAMFARELDIAYIGPSPAINGYVKSGGQALRIVAGATSGGAALVIRSGSGIARVEDFHRKRIASPQLGNTQDVALRAWLKNNGMVLSERGGDVQVLPIKNADQLTLFLTKQIDGAWTVEPWVSRLVKEGGGKIFLEESALWENGEYVTANIIVNKKFLDNHPDIVKKWLKAHVNVTIWINGHLPEAKEIINRELKRLLNPKGSPIFMSGILDSSISSFPRKP